MRRLLSIFGCIAILAALLGALFLSAGAEAPVYVDMQFTASKDTYAAGDTIKTTLVLQNNYQYPITNLSVELELPDGYTVKSPADLPSGSAMESGKQQSFSIQLVPEGAAKKGNWVAALILAVCILALIGIIATVVILIVKKKRSHKSVVSLLLVCAMITGICSVAFPTKAAEVTRHQITQSVTVTLGGQQQKIAATVYFDDNPLADDFRLDTSKLGYSASLKAFTVSTSFDGFYGTLEEPQAYNEVILEIYDAKDNLVQRQSVNAEKNWAFEKVGLCPGMNRVRITATGSTSLTLELPVYDFYGNHFANLEGSELDTDTDGLADLIEASFGTDPNNPDTDGDDLSDYDEIIHLNTDPLLADTDGDGIPDSEEDYDSDGITNKEEMEKGLSPVLDDTDRDGISDLDELKKHKTDPLKVDSDGDGASDGWELDNGYKPKQANETFSLSCKTDPVSKTNSVSAEVALKVNGNEADVESLQINSVSVADNPYISNCIAGYLGSAYDFTLDGTFDSATLTFRYDSALGELGDEFQPRIYHFNEDTCMFEELPDQTVRDGVVTAKTTHFSIYTLLNKVIFEYVKHSAAEYMEEVKQGLADELNAMATADIAIVMDTSASMAWNDPADKSREVANYFIDHIRPQYDSISILTYTSTASLIQRPTNDPLALRQALNRVNLDNGVNSSSGTNGLAALNAAIDALVTAKGSYRYILFFSDGDDAPLEDQYRAILQRAVRANVQILCVGIHTPKESYLQELAEGTKGRYYTMDETTDVDAVFGDAISIFDAITPSDKDSNNDGISDFITKMICEGKIALQNGEKKLVDIDLNFDKNGNPSDDYDGDGLKNGDEIGLCYNPTSKIAYIRMSSNPCLTDSDADGYSDRTEVESDMAPMSWSVEANPLDYLMGKDFLYEKVVADYDPNSDTMGWYVWWKNLSLNIDAILFAGGLSNREEVYYELMAQYYLEHGAKALEEAEKVSFIRDMLIYLDNMHFTYINSRVELASSISDTTLLWDANKNIYKLCEEVAELKAGKKLSEIKISDKGLVNLLTEELAKIDKTIPIEWSGAKYAKGSVKFLNGSVDFVEELGEMGDVLTYVEAAVDAIDVLRTVAKVEAKSAVFLANLEILELVSKTATDDYAAFAAQQLLMDISEEFTQNFASAYYRMLRECYQFGRTMIPELLKTIPVVGTIIALIDISFSLLNLIFEFSDEVESIFRILCYNELDAAYTTMIKGLSGSGRRRNCYCMPESSSPQFTRYLLNLSQVRALAEDQYWEYVDASTGPFTGICEDQVKADVKYSKLLIEEATNSITSSKIYDPTSVHIGGGGGRPF